MNGFRGAPAWDVGHTPYKKSGTGSHGVGNVNDYLMTKEITQP